LTNYNLKIPIGSVLYNLKIIIGYRLYNFYVFDR